MSEAREEDWQDWIGRTETCSEVLSPAPAVGLAALLDLDELTIDSGFELPPLWHWLYFLNPCRQSELAEDGHASRGRFLPPSPLPSRMWAGSKLQFSRPLRIGEHIARHSRIADVEAKQGRSGQLLFVRVEHSYQAEDGERLQEQQTLVYREAGAVAAAPAPEQPQRVDFRRQISPEVSLLFRYSALTFNAHRIHYDRSYATEQEGYPGLVVHGPLVATLLIDLLARQDTGRPLIEFEFRALSPLFDGQDFSVCGRQADAEGRVFLWAENPEGGEALRAIAKLA